ncbi:hypothetical protein PHLCEN_2v7119 [Hermanssonia centrifuga]|uniref:Uncharacterized protein n=1 Tax=Hermanssonia centrifuga TaxID=98765 RepID=A0A2R6NXF3_9APHY|nr:hypothetical protein PHLCEN_2v7119 [Hermanssonia centrifuga]
MRCETETEDRWGSAPEGISEPPAKERETRGRCATLPWAHVVATIEPWRMQTASVIR